MLQIAKTAARTIATEYQWSYLNKEAEIYLVRNQSAYELPSDFSRFVNNTMWDRVDSRPIDGVSPQVWQEFKSGLVKTSIYKRFRVRADNNAKALFIDPTPTTTQCTFECRDGVQVKIGVSFDYLSDQYALSSAGAGQSTFSLDTDSFVLSDEVLEKSIMWRWLRRLSQDYTEEKRSYEVALDVAKAQDGGAGSIKMDGTRDFPYPNIPESGVGL